ncbi:MAG TPA: efflux RND transporter periplasmic adaptor subunit [Methylophilus sp.]|uniref:efflux RND transporter periplasmic adaptor subunit n=1 Tax=Methylophilus sp. TaxID=29541 RepID=UPI002B60F168|nr:efflux RND transporter periplasmic adaptor subunit [Methylophilus sp.]HSH86727.1 efflux RND transporter periplasmic adaptor subunit [Methylophilus sp.]
MKLLKKIVVFIVLAAAAAGAYYYYQKTHQPKPEDLYRLDEVTRGNIEQSVSANGTLNPVSLISVGTQVSGIVRKLYVDFNDPVKKDQVLLELDSALFNAQIAQSKGTVRNNQAAVELAIANEKRMRELYAQEYVSKQELDTAVQVMKSAKAQLETARGLLARDQTNLNFTIIRSPVSGVVINRVVDVGQTVAASFQTPTLIQIAQDLAKMQIDTSFAEADIGKIKVGQKVSFNVDAFPNRNFEGVVKQVRLNSTNTSNVVTYNVVVSVDNQDLTLLPGMTAYVNIAVEHAKQTLLVPNAALRYKPKQDADAAKDDKQKEHGNDKKDSAAGERKASPVGEKRGEWGGARPGENGGEGLHRGGPGQGAEGQGGYGRGERRGKRQAGGNIGKVYVLREGKPTMVSVRIGITDGRSTEIHSRDLAEGDKIIVSELQPDNSPKPGGNNNNARAPRMF